MSFSNTENSTSFILDPDNESSMNNNSSNLNTSSATNSQSATSLSYEIYSKYKKIKRKKIFDERE